MSIDRPRLRLALALAGPMLLLLAFTVFLQRRGIDRLQALPAVVITAGLLTTAAVRRRQRRRSLLLALRQDSTADG